MKVAVITGTSSGLGEAFAQTLLDLDWKVYGISRRTNEKLIKNENFHQIVMDLRSPLDLQQLTKEIGDKKINLLVNNAGMVYRGDAKELNRKSYEELFSVHYVSPIELLQFLYDRLDGGMVISTLSDASHIGWPSWGLYGASKAALWLQMKSFAAENPNITVYNLHPSAVDTPITDSVGEDAIAERSEFMTIKDITTIFVQLITGTMALTSGSSIFIHNDWEAEEMSEIGKDMYIYNVDTESLKKL